MNWQGDVIISFPFSWNPVVLSRGCKRMLSVTPQTELGMGINTKRVIIAGLAAGLVLNVLDFIINGVLFADRMTADMNAFQPGLGDAMATMGTNIIAGFVIMDYVIGMLLAYTYAAI